MQIFQSSLNPKPMNAFDNSFPLFTQPGTHAIVKFRYLLRLSLQNISFQTPKSCEDSVPWLCHGYQPEGVGHLPEGQTGVCLGSTAAGEQVTLHTYLPMLSDFHNFGQILTIFQDWSEL